jgi:hypothetical protein
VNSEDIFVVPGSAWSVGDDNSLDATVGVPGGAVYPPGPDATTLATGEVGYAYITALNDTSNPQFPLLVDGFQIATTAGGTNGGTYPQDKTITGGIWGGTRAIVIFVDGSGRVMKCDGGAIGTQFVSRPGRTYNICSTGEVATEGWLSTSNFILNPAGAGP